MSELIFYTTSINNRLKYVTDLLFKQLLSINIRLCVNKNEYLESNLPKINYSKDRILVEEYFIPAYGLLFEKHIQYQKTITNKLCTPITLFSSNKKTADLDFDFLAMIFYLISRYEEYLPFEADEHGRFSAVNSIAYKEDFLHLPLVNLWAIELGKQLQKRFPSIQTALSSYQYIPTYDIDMAWAYKHKGAMRTWGAYTKALAKMQFAEANKQLKVIRGKEKDPFQTFEYFSDWHQQHQDIKPIYFFLLGKHSAYDKNNAPHIPAFQKLISQTASDNRVGIHPSYMSNQSESQLDAEINQLKAIVGKEVNASRQHYLKLTFPQTYRQLIAKGIKEDFTMGYASALGFRASIATPFYWYDLEKEEATHLLIYPFMLMDVTLKNEKYLGLKPQEAIQKANEIIRTTKAVGGTFVSIWHNSSLSYIDDWQEWKSVFESIFQMALPA